MDDSEKTAYGWLSAETPNDMTRKIRKLVVTTLTEVPKSIFNYYHNKLDEAYNA